MTVNMKGAVMSHLSVFLTDLGWCGLFGAESTVHRLVMGHTSDDKVREAMHDWIDPDSSEGRHSRDVRATARSANPRRTTSELLTTDGGRHSRDVRATARLANLRRTTSELLITEVGIVAIQECDWFPELRGRLQRYAQGVMTEFDDIVVELPGQTDFQKRVVRATRRIKYGETVTYRQLAINAGAPKAARAVGNAMAANRFPIIVPCHRVVAAAGKLGGFSAPQGVSLKEQMLLMEAETVNR